MPRNITTFTSLLVSDRKDPVVHTSTPRPNESGGVVTDAGALLVSGLTVDALKALEVTLLQQGVN